MTEAVRSREAAEPRSVLDTPRSPVGRRHHRFRTGSLVIDLVLLVLAVAMIAPLVWLISNAFTQPERAFGLPPDWIPVHVTWRNFTDVFTFVPFGRMALNSLVVATLSTVGALLTSVPAAYAFSRLRFPARGVIFVGLLSALMVPGQLTIIPVFIIMRVAGLTDTLGALIIPALVNVFNIFFLRQYFNTIPHDLDEAARIDGAGHLWIAYRMLVPLSGPAIATLVILDFQAAWNDYFGPLIFLTSPEHMTLTIGLVTLQSGQGGGPAVVVFAAITLVVVPVLALFLIFQRAFVASVAQVGLRG